MARAITRQVGMAASADTPDRAQPQRDYRKAMSDNIAYALLVYTGLQIFVTMRALEGTKGSLLPYVALIVLVAAIIPGCRRFERRWEWLSGEAARAAETGVGPAPDLADMFARDRMLLWALAIGLPLVLTALFRGLAALV
jgi:hypothetical protein